MSVWGENSASSRVCCVLANNPSPLIPAGTNTWLVGEPEEQTCVVIDPGPDDIEHLGHIAGRCLQEGRRIAAILLTHDHPDHGDGAERLSTLTGAPIFSKRSKTLYEGLIDIPDSSLKLTTVPLPGHSSDSVGFYLPADAVLFTGDVIFAQSSTMVQWPDGVLASYLESLDVLLRFVTEEGVERFLTGHGSSIDNPIERIARCRRHRFQRLNQVVAAVRAGIPADAERIVDAVYNDVDPKLHFGALCSVNAQLRYAFDTGLLEEHRG